MKNYSSDAPKLAVYLLAIFVLLSFVLVFAYVNKERSRDLESWRSKLNIMADINESRLENLLSQQKTKLRMLSVNPSLQLFMTEGAALTDKKDAIYNAQFSYVKNLLRSAAIDHGVGEAEGNSLNTENKKIRNRGIALFGSDGSIIMASSGFIRDKKSFSEKIEKSINGGEMEFIDLFEAGEGQALYGYAVPVLQIHGADKKSAGCIVVLFDANETIYKSIRLPHVEFDTDEAILVAKSDNTIIYISPLIKGHKLFSRRSIGDDQFAASYIFSHIDGYKQLKDYNGDDVLVIGREIKNVPWVLMQKIDSKEALKESDDHQQFLIITVTLVILLLSIIFVAIWKHSTSQRLQKLTEQLELRTALLNAVSDNIHEYIFMLDEQDKFIFSNHSLANDLGVVSVDISGKSAASVFGIEVAKIIAGLHCEEAEEKIDRCIVVLPIGESEKEYHVSIIILKSGEYKNNRLFVLHDVTKIKTEQRKREKLSSGIISTLVRAVDLHDPYCINHSSRTCEVAMEIAAEMKLTKEQCEALEMSAMLANIGKLFVPKEILTKMNKLSTEEDEVLKKNIGYAVDILKELSFDGPVVQIISQKNEFLDGSGYPEGLLGDDILIESRILAVANAFVAMTSSRAYRTGKEISNVIDILLEQSDKLYDRRIVAALFHIAENKSDWNKWKDVNNINI
ncbi:MAG: HD domain-containing protein [Gammaproteobacteria bacterium]|nr:HD domain-containing protein [Gammaproteobacteria bacterium]